MAWPALRELPWMGPVLLVVAWCLARWVLRERLAWDRALVLEPSRLGVRSRTLLGTRFRSLGSPEGVRDLGVDVAYLPTDHRGLGAARELRLVLLLESGEEVFLAHPGREGSPEEAALLGTLGRALGRDSVTRLYQTSVDPGAAETAWALWGIRGLLAALGTLLVGSMLLAGGPVDLLGAFAYEVSSLDPGAARKGAEVYSSCALFLGLLVLSGRMVEEEGRQSRVTLDDLRGEIRSRVREGGEVREEVLATYAEVTDVQWRRLTRRRVVGTPPLVNMYTAQALLEGRQGIDLVPALPEGNDFPDCANMAILRHRILSRAGELRTGGGPPAPSDPVPEDLTLSLLPPSGVRRLTGECLLLGLAGSGLLVGLVLGRNLLGAEWGLLPGGAFGSVVGFLLLLVLMSLARRFVGPYLVSREELLLELDEGVVLRRRRTLAGPTEERIASLEEVAAYGVDVGLEVHPELGTRTVRRIRVSLELADGREFLAPDVGEPGGLLEREMLARLGCTLEGLELPPPRRYFEVQAWHSLRGPGRFGRFLIGVLGVLLVFTLTGHGLGTPPAEALATYLEPLLRPAHLSPRGGAGPFAWLATAALLAGSLAVLYGLLVTGLGRWLGRERRIYLAEEAGEIRERTRAGGRCWDRVLARFRDVSAVEVVWRKCDRRVPTNQKDIHNRTVYETVQDDYHGVAALQEGGRRLMLTPFLPKGEAFPAWADAGALSYRILGTRAGVRDT